MKPDAVLGELDGLRALARSLVHGDADVDDLLQDTAVAALEHPPVTGEGPVRVWLKVVLRNRWRMDRRGAARRQARERAVAAGLADRCDADTDSIDRARALEKLAAALVALDEPFRSTVIRRYFDGRSAAEIARELRVPPGTVRSRLATGLARLRAALDDSAPRWARAFAPLSLFGATVKTKTSAILVILLLLLGVVGAVWLWPRHRAPVAAGPGQAATPTSVATPRPDTPRGAAVAVPPLRDPLPGQGRASVEDADTEGGVIAGRVVNWSRGDGVAGAELTFTSDAGALTVRSREDGTFELAPPAPGRFVLSAIAAPGFLPYAPELLHSTVHVALAKGKAVRGITVFLFPALDYRGRVVDAHGAPVAGARVRLLGTPAGEQVIDKLATDWTTDRDGAFAFHGADDAVLEATRGNQRGWARLDAAVQITRQLTIAIGEAPLRDATITGRTIDGSGAPVGDALVRAQPITAYENSRSTAFATSGPDGSFTLAGLDRDAYDLAAEAEDHAPAAAEHIAGGTRDVTLTLEAGLPLSGTVVDGNGRPAPAYTLLVLRHEGAGRQLLLARSVVEPRGEFRVQLAKGNYELIASATGWAPSRPTPAAAGATGVTLSLSAGATLRGVVVAAEDGKPIAYARVTREARGGGASPQPANAGTVTRADGTFELTGILPGSLSIEVSASGYHPRIEAGMHAGDGEALGPIALALARVAEGEQPKIEMVGIGIVFAADGDALRVQKLIPGGGAEAAGIAVGDRVIAIDGMPVAPLGIDGAVGKVRGVVGTTLTVTLRRGDQDVLLVVERRKIRV